MLSIPSLLPMSPPQTFLIHAGMLKREVILKNDKDLPSDKTFFIMTEGRVVRMGCPGLFGQVGRGLLLDDLLIYLFIHSANTCGVLSMVYIFLDKNSIMNKTQSLLSRSLPFY